MNYKFFFIFLFLLIVFSINTFAYPVGFNYIEVRSNTYPVYMPYQYANYYDFIDLRYSVYSNYYNPIPMIVSPKVYGINLSGQRVFLHNLQTSSFVLNPYLNYTYSYNPMFSFDPSYQFYEVVLDLQSLDGSYQSSDASFIYYQDSQGQTPPTSPQTNPSCEDFSISGFSDIYLQEDRRDYYNLYIINSIDKPLTITSITTNPNDPTDLEIEDISYPFTISQYQTRSAQFSLFTDTVSSNYTGYFDIKVNAEYENISCEKIYTVKYHINDSSLENTASCNDLEITDNFFIINSNENKDIEINLKNSSFDYYFQVSSIDIKDPTGSIVESNIKNSIYNISKDSSKILKVNLNSDYTDVFKTEKLTLKIDGYFKRDNREDKRCKINKDISIRVSPNTQSFNDCSNIKIFTKDVSLYENEEKSFSKENGFYVLNNTNKLFTITGINYTKNKNNLEILSKSINYNLYPLSSNSLNFNLKGLEVNNNLDIKTNIYIEGYFQNGDACSFQDIKSEFNVLLLKDSLCSRIDVIDSFYKDGVNTFKIKNNSDVDFFVNDIIYQDRQNTNVNIIDKSFSIFKNSLKDFKVSTSKEGSFNLLVKGKFSNGVECDYIDTRKGYFSYQDFSFQENGCDFILDYPNTKTVSSDTENVMINFKNQSGKNGVLKIESTGAVITNPIIYFSKDESFTKEIKLTNIKNPKNIIYTVEIFGCDKKVYFTTLNQEISFLQPISLSSYLSKITTNQKTFVNSFTLKNNTSFTKEIFVNFTGFSENAAFVFSQDSSFIQETNSFLINPNSSKTIYFKTHLLSDDETVYQGNLEVNYQEDLILKEPLIINKTLLTDDILFSTEIIKKKDFYYLDFLFENLSDKSQNIEIIFKDLNSFTINGSNSFVIDAKSNLKQSYVISDHKKDVLEYQVKNNNKTIGKGEFNLKEIKEDSTPSILSGFFSLSNFKWSFYLLIIVVIVYLIYIYIKNTSKKRKLNKRDSTFIKNKVSLKKEVFLEEKKIEHPILKKEVSFKDLENLDSK
jgi:hypothetical protein